MSTLNHKNSLNNEACSFVEAMPVQNKSGQKVEQESSPIGFFDSGVGGLSVYARFKKLLPNENTLYFGDLANMPYGNKTKEQLIGYARNILDFYKSKKVKAVAIACNTSSAQAYDIIKDEYNFKIYPIIQSCTKIIAFSGVSRIGVFATEATVNSGVYTKELRKYNQFLDVCEIACPAWVPIVESSNYTDEASKKSVKVQLDKMLEFQPNKIILGCTHYPYLLSLLKNYAPESLFIDPAEIFVQYIKNDLENDGLINCDKTGGSEQIFVSANPESFMEHSRIFYTVKNLPILKNNNCVAV